MRNYIFFALMLATALFSGCKKDNPTTQYTLEFRAEFDGTQLDLAKTYKLNQIDVQFTRFNLFLCDLTLVKEDGTEHLLSEVEFINFTPDNDQTSILEPIKVKFVAPSGNYKSLKIGYGLNNKLNAKSPNEYSVSHPLAKAESEFWDGWQSYIFMKIEGRGQTNPDPDPEVSMVYHCGSDAVYRTGTKQIALNLDGSDKTQPFHSI